MANETHEPAIIFDSAVEQALRDECAAARLRLDPDCNISELHAKLAEQGHKLVLTETGLVIDGATTTTAKDALIAASKHPELKNSFIVLGSRARHLDDFSKNPAEHARQVGEFVAAFGMPAFEKLVADSRRPALKPSVVICATMSADDWKNLTLKEKSKAISGWGDRATAIVGQICARRAKK